MIGSSPRFVKGLAALFLWSLLAGALLLDYGPFRLGKARRLAASQLQHAGGSSYYFPTDGMFRARHRWLTDAGDPDTNESPQRSGLVLCEDDRPLAAPHSLHQEIVEQGEGRYSHWLNGIYFSASDNTDPRTNGRRYVVEYHPRVPVWTIVVTGLLLTVLHFQFLQGAGRALGGANPAHICLGLMASAAVAYGAIAWNKWDGVLPGSIKGIPYSDARRWDTLAYDFATGEHFDRDTWSGWALRRPGCFLLAGSFYAFVGHWIDGLRLVYFLLQIVAVGLVFDAVRRLTDLRVALLVAAGLLWQELRPLFALTTLSETLGDFFGIASTWLLVWGLDRSLGRQPRAPAPDPPRRIHSEGWPFALSGFLFAVANLTRTLTLLAGAALPFAVVLVAARARFHPQRWRVGTMGAASFVLGMMVTIAPWVIRNVACYGVACISDNSAEMLYSAASPEFGVWTPEVSLQATHLNTLPERYRFYQEGAMRQIHAHPIWYAQHVAHDMALGLEAMTPPRWMFVALGFLWLLQGRIRPDSSPNRPYRFALAVAALGALLLLPSALLVLLLGGCLAGSLWLRAPLCLLTALLVPTWISLGLMASNHDGRLVYTLHWVGHAIALGGAWEMLNRLAALRPSRPRWYCRSPLPVPGMGWLGRVGQYAAAVAGILLTVGLAIASYRNLTNEHAFAATLPPDEEQSYIDRALAAPEAEPYRPLRRLLVAQPFAHIPNKVAAFSPEEMGGDVEARFDPVPVSVTLLTGTPCYFALLPGPVLRPPGTAVLVGIPGKKPQMFHAIAIFDPAAPTAQSRVGWATPELAARHARFLRDEFAEDRPMTNDLPSGARAP